MSAGGCQGRDGLRVAGPGTRPHPGLAAACLAVALGFAPVTPATAAPVTVSGRVIDAQGVPLEAATVACPARRTGVVTDAEGRFALPLEPGHATIEIAQLGYERRRLEVTVAPGMAPLVVTMIDEPVALAEVQVAASSFGRVGAAEGATLRRMQVLTTPGGAADVMQALRALPGMNAPNEGAAVYVRGGDPSETLIRLDGSEVGHPYHYEGASGGLFSAFDAYMVQGASFSSGGFPARHGGALSGVLDITTIDPGDLRTANLGLNMVGANLSATWALVPGRLSLCASARGSDTGLLMDVYGSNSDYESAPVSHDAAAKLLWRHAPGGYVAVTGILGGDRTAVHANVLNAEAVYRAEARNRVVLFDATQAFGERLALHLRAGHQRHRSDWSWSAFGHARRETDVQAAIEGEWTPHPRHQVAFGARFQRRETALAGTAAADSVDVLPGAPVRVLDLAPALDTPGLFVEDKLRVWGPLYATLGVRADRASNAGAWTVDPRAALAWRLGERQTLRIAGGRYHQPADPERLDPVYGNPRLRPSRADHLIGGWEWADGETDLRVEAFHKAYRDLVTDDPATWYANRGRGYARGVDAFAKGAVRWVGGWVSYGWLDTRRLEGDAVREVPSPYGVRHSLTVVANWHATPAWIVGLRQGWSTGAPWTPVVGRRWDPARGVWRPVFGEDGSAEMPAYHRTDVRVTRLFSLPRGLGLPASAPCVAYIEGLNVLGTPNVLEYVWNADWSERHERRSYFSRRMLVAGFSLTW